jgi:hypothetical protein
MYLPMLADLDAASQYSWGSAVLAHLYRNLCDAAIPTGKEISGALPLLQVKCIVCIHFSKIF